MILTFEFHADFETFLEPAKRASFPLGLVYVTRPLGHARVHFLVLHGTFEEAFTRLAREQTVMVTGHLVAAHRAKFLDALFGVGQLGTGGGRVDAGGGGHGRAAAVTADGHVLLEAVHGAGHAASIATCGTEQIRCVHITELITALVTAAGRGRGAHHRVRGSRGGRGRLMVLGRRRHVLVQGWR